MSVHDYVDVFGAPSAAAIAAEAAAALNTTPVLQGTTSRGEHWAVTGLDWSVEVDDGIGVEVLADEAEHTVVVRHLDDLAAQHQITERIFERLSAHTRWGLLADSDEDSFPLRTRPTIIP